MKRVVLAFAGLLFAASPVLAQSPQTNAVPTRPDATFAPTTPQGGTGHHGFTVFANIGAGVQHGGLYQQTGGGVGGLNFGIGKFVTHRLAVLFRISRTRATLDHFFGPTTSGVWGGTIQYWINKRCSIEAGAGVGGWTDGYFPAYGFGLILAFQASVFQKGNHHVRAGVDYAPVFTNSPVHNVGFTVGYQYAKAR